MTTYQFRRGVGAVLTLAGESMGIVIVSNVVENGFILERGGLVEVVRKQVVLMKRWVESKLRIFFKGQFVMPNQN